MGDEIRTNPNVTSAVAPVTPAQPAVAPEKSNKKMFIIIGSIVAVVIIIGIVTAFFLMSGDERSVDLEEISADLYLRNLSSPLIEEVENYVKSYSYEEYCGVFNRDEDINESDRTAICMSNNILGGCKRSFMVIVSGNNPPERILYEILGGEGTICDIKLTVLENTPVPGEERRVF